MRVLLIAYEYPPIVAAQALRWHYLANALAKSGIEVHVICPLITSVIPYPVTGHPSVIEHRVWPGPFIGLAQYIAGRTSEDGGISSGPSAVGGSSIAHGVYRVMRRFFDHVLYPDVRTEWFPFAQRKIRGLIGQIKFDAVISSHEPGVDLLLGLWFRRRTRLPWLVDYADPLCAPYSPRWRGWLDRWVESKVIQSADKVLLTTDRLRDLLIDRHGPTHADKYVCVPQGAPSQAMKGAQATLRMCGKMNLVFTGNLYEAFRNPSHFAEALKQLASDEIAVTIVGDNARFKYLFDDIPNVLFLGRSSHFDCLAMQREADVLLNFGNAQSYQIPGKIYEYMGAGRPILHIQVTPDDPGAVLLSEIGIGVVVDNEPELIAAALVSLLERWRAGELSVGEEVTRLLLERHGWDSRAEVISDIITEVVRSSSRSHAHAE